MEPKSVLTTVAFLSSLTLIHELAEIPNLIFKMYNGAAFLYLIRRHGVSDADLILR